MGALVAGPALALSWMGARWGAREAWVFVGLPCLVLLPNYYLWSLPGLPEASFHNYLLLASAALLLHHHRKDRWSWSWVDALPILLVAVSVISETEATGWHDGRNLMAQDAMLVLCPYLIGRLSGLSNGLWVGTAMSLVAAGTLVGWVAPYEFRMGVNPFDALRSVWHEAVPWDAAVYRLGFRRVAGPFGHPICQGFFFGMTLPLLLWLRRTKVVKGWAFWTLLGGQLFGLVSTLSRGPALGAAAALCVVGIGGTRFRKRAATALFAVAVLGAGYSANAVVTYLGEERVFGASDAKETAVYRRRLWENYTAVVANQPLFGHGRHSVPVVEGQKSIDNQFLLLALQHGVPASLVFTALLLSPIVLAGWAGFRRHADHPEGQGAIALCGLSLGAVVTQTTVFAGPQTSQILLICQGMAVSVAHRLRVPPSSPEGIGP